MTHRRTAARTAVRQDNRTAANVALIAVSAAVGITAIVLALS